MIAPRQKDAPGRVALGRRPVLGRISYCPARWLRALDRDQRDDHTGRSWQGDKGLWRQPGYHARREMRTAFAKAKNSFDLVTDSMPALIPYVDKGSDTDL